MSRPRSLRLSAFLVAVSLVVLAVGLVRQQSSGHDEEPNPDDRPIAVAQAFLVGLSQAEESDDATVRLASPNTEDDFPALAKAKDGTVWLAYVEYKPGPPIVMEQVAERRFDSLVPKGNGDRIRLRRFDGKEWSSPIDVTGGGLDVWRPTVSVDGKGRVVVAWAQKTEGDWEIFYRRYTPSKKAGAKGQWSKVVRVTNDRGSDFHVVSTTDASGRVWLVWQGWRTDNFDLHAALVAERGVLKKKDVFVSTKANEWTPAIAADSKGNVYVAWDTYNKGNYDVRLMVIGNPSFSVLMGDSPRFEAKVHLACDAHDRLWIAYEEGDVLWGQDYQGNTPQKVGLENLGNGLYVRRTVQVKCFVDGQLKQPTGDLQQALTGRLQRNKSLPRLCADPQGGLWLLLRHHPLAGGRGEAWHSYALRYEGGSWSEPAELPHSSNILDNRPALTAFGEGVLAVYSSDSRTQTRNRDQDDLFAAVLAAGEAASPKLKADTPVDVPDVEPVHPNEKAAIARVRAYRVKVGGRELRPIRGEFHRHTEYTAHRDQDGTLEDSWRYALDAGKLDWMGNGDHDNGFGHEYLWWQIQKISDLFHNPPHFVVAVTHERSVRYPSGHRNVILPDRGIRPLPRLANQGPKLYGTPGEGAPDIKLLYDYLKHFHGICSLHTSGTNMGSDWRDNNPEVEPVVEIYQGHRHNYEHFGAPRSATEQTQIGGYRPAGFVWNALEKGYRLGFQSSSDHVSTHMSYAVVLVEEPTRRAIIDAFKQRHCYAATDNILLSVRSGEYLMGDEFTTKENPTLEVFAHGAARLARIHVVRDNKYVYSTEPESERAEFRFTDRDVKPGTTHYYYVRVEQDDGNLAWASPMWITYKP